MEKYNFTTKLYEVCSKDELSPINNCVHFLNGFALATDGHMAIRQSLEYHSIINPEILDNKSMHRENFKAIMQFDIAECNEDGIQCKDKDGRTAFFEYFDRQGKEIPNFDSVFNNLQATQLSFIGIKPEFLYKMSKALYSPDGIVRIRFNGVDKAILIDAIGVDNQDAIVMPAILNGVLF